MKKTQIAVIIGCIIIAVTIALAIFVNASKSNTPAVQITTAHQSAILSYAGKNGVDALTLLKQHATVGQASSGLVTAINGTTADAKKHQYWAFYVNGKLASIGPADYKTKDSDKITWKLETY